MGSTEGVPPVAGLRADGAWTILSSMSGSPVICRLVAYRRGRVRCNIEYFGRTFDVALRPTPRAGLTGDILRPVTRGRAITTGVGAVLILLCSTGCAVEAGSAMLVDGSATPESAVQQDSATFLAQNPDQPATDAYKAIYNRAQITFRVRHVLIGRALAAAGITVSGQQVASATAALAAQQAQSAQQTQSLAAQLDLPLSAEPDVVHDLVGLQALVRTIPPAGVKVADVSVTAQGVPAANRDEAVTLRSRYLADPAAMDRAVLAAGTAGGAAPKQTYDLMAKPEYASTGLYQAVPGGVVILPQKDSYLVLQTTGRTTSTANLLQSRFNSVDNITSAFDLGALAVSGRQQGADIAVNPRYGIWDPVSVQVVPGNSGL